MGGNTFSRDKLSPKQAEKLCVSWFWRENFQKFVAENGADLNIKTTDGMPVFVYTLRKEDYSCVLARILEVDETVLDKNPGYKAEVLRYVIIFRLPDLLKQVLDAGCRDVINEPLRDIYSRTVSGGLNSLGHILFDYLMCIEETGVNNSIDRIISRKLAMIRILLKNGANIYIKGRSVLDLVMDEIGKKYDRNFVNHIRETQVRRIDTIKSILEEFPSPSPSPLASRKLFISVICCICEQAPTTVCFNPCGHSCVCNECYDMIEEEMCPLCRTKIDSTMIVEGLTSARA